MKKLIPKYLIELIVCLSVVGCVSAPVPRNQNIAEIYPQLPRPDMTLNIAGLGPCDDDPDRNFSLNSQHPVTVLVHGCFGSAGRFRTLSEVLAFHGQQSICFSYNDRDKMMLSSKQLSVAIEQLEKHFEKPRITVMGHSQGGLVARKALVSEREGAINTKSQLKLVTISAPLSGIRAARFCASPLLRIASLGINDLLCRLVSGKKWHEITAASDFIKYPGVLDTSVERYLMVATDETDSCRKYNDKGRCVKDDYVFSLDEQKIPSVSIDTNSKKVQVRAGHIEIVGESGITPVKLIQILQDEGFIQPTDPSRVAQFNALLMKLYGAN